ncbi:hypothetical protein KZY44_002685 [Vibrio vulnificus]|uniref:hypothetical protein n=1 Tax=Vibrio vulnificus TaxID=672 RepID=UPI000C7CB66A|nr:hypothetical protein [Vibrio vulnificus]AUL94751.1 hypothetical protein FORC54_0606 [Vibrio vulnificus]EHI9277541.1 hypothetical protein [Vibrio vulnificus]EHU9454235.1 hypothetical protein [Vibrio vulnificus]EHZ2651415.1 hypothetical protein [Vibrio vulnificus]PNG70609.1 hypothetical protein TI06_20205 [Vibrio vulnificus]
MIDKDTPFNTALISSVGIEKPRNIRIQVEDGVIRRCIERGLLCEEDKRSQTKNYKWVCKVIDNDFSALILLRREKVNLTTSSDLKELFFDIDDMCEGVIDCIVKRILDRKF